MKVFSQKYQRILNFLLYSSLADNYNSWAIGKVLEVLLNIIDFKGILCIKKLRIGNFVRNAKPNNDFTKKETVIIQQKLDIQRKLFIFDRFIPFFAAKWM